MHTGFAPSVAFLLFLDIFRQKGTFLPEDLHILNDAEEDANLLILNIKLILTVFRSSFRLFSDSGDTSRVVWVSPMVGVELLVPCRVKFTQIGGCRAIARGCRMSALCSSGGILERTELLFEGEDPISAFFFFMLLEKSAINSGERKLSFMVQNSCVCFVPKHF